jgi:cellulose synthase/poly-beta-1,6-N-acetylglucosamine synthase-like glycosyltransferase
LKDEEIVIIFDADAEVPKDFFWKMNSMLEKYDVVQARSVGRNGLSPGNIYTSCLILLVNPFLNIFNSIVITGSGFGVRRNVFEKVLFNEKILIEDFKFGVDISKVGFKSFYDKDNVIIISSPKKEKDMESQLIRWGFGGMQSFLDFSLTPNYIISFFCVVYEVIYSVIFFPIIFPFYLIHLIPIILIVHWNFKKINLKLLENTFIAILIIVKSYLKALFKYITNKKLVWIPTKKD